MPNSTIKPDSQSEVQDSGTLISEDGSRYYSLVDSLKLLDFNGKPSNPNQTLPNRQCTSLVPRPLDLLPPSIPVSQRDLTLENYDLAKMRSSPVDLPQRYLFTQSMPVNNDLEITDFEKDCEQVIMSGEDRRRRSDMVITDKYISMIRKEVVISEDVEEEEAADDKTETSDDKTKKWEDLTEYKTL